MSIDKTNIQSKITTTIAAANTSCTTSDLVASTRAFCGFINDSCNYITLACDLPDIAAGITPEGTMFYVQELRRPVFATTIEWKGLDGRTYRNDTPLRELYAWGMGTAGQLGNNCNQKVSSPVREITSDSQWCAVAASSSSHTLAVKCTGELYVWGSNGSFGVLGLGTSGGNYSSPVQEFCSATNWCAVTAGCIGSAALKTDGSAWNWGYNYYGQLGINNTSNKNTPVREFCSSTNWCAISNSGCLHVVAVKTSGQLWGWGYNLQKQLGDGTNISRRTPVQEATSATDWCTVSAGSLHTVAVKSTGTLYGWGNNGSGQAGVGTSTGPSTPTQDISSATSWCNASAGHLYSLGIKTDGTLWGWGDSSCYQVGAGTNVNRSSPVQEFCSSTNWCIVEAGRETGRGIKTDGTLWGWGNGLCGQLAGYSTSCSPVQECTLSTEWCTVSGGNNFVAAIKLK